MPQSLGQTNTDGHFEPQQAVSIEHGIQANIRQFSLNLVQIFLVGLTIGMTRVVIPGLAESEFGLADEAFFLLASFVVVFGIVKAVMNLFAGKLSETYGRKKILILGWLVALPIPFILLYAPNWNWIIFTTVLLGFNQGLCWSMALNSKLDLAKSTQKGLVNGVNEFAGYAAVGIAGLVTAYIVTLFGPREGLFYFSLTVIVLGLVLARLTIVETLPWAKLHQQNARVADKTEETKSLGQLFKLASIESKPLFALNQAGLVEKFTDAIVWIFLPIYFMSQGITLIESGAIIAIYGLVWGAAQLITGPLSDKIGRKGLIVWGMWFCGIGIIAIPFTQGISLWSLEAAFIGIGMAMLYPNLGASVGDFSPPQYRASLVGIYRFWRDSGYAIGALVMGIMAQWSQDLLMPFWFVGIAMFVSGLIVQLWLPSRQVEQA
ncbi:MFS transporter [Shewanella sp.]|uniref:MFS transporter n=1 Tax=Shewanella sp. TaxID=50422 RepID=UPI001EC9EF76|nr:MFS transporter [Shewanella sp.]NRB22933.1 MFS transporter [Shewanella sp.]